MDCATFDRWLDRGAAPGDARARAHAESCPRCAMSFAAMREIDAWLAADDAVPATPAPAGFTDAVMRSVALEPRVVAMPAATADEFPWWIGSLRQPATVLAAALAAVAWWWRDAVLDAAAQMLAFGNGVWSQAGDLSHTVASALHPTSAVTVMPALADPLVAVAVAVSLLPLVAYISIRLGRWSERLVGG